MAGHPAVLCGGRRQHGRRYLQPAQHRHRGRSLRLGLRAHPVQGRVHDRAPPAAPPQSRQDLTERRQPLQPPSHLPQLPGRSARPQNTRKSFSFCHYIHVQVVLI